MLQKGLMVVVSGPAGTGKGTVIKMLRETNTNLAYSVSVTTRKPRAGEEEGINYFFRTREEFKKMIENNELIEWVEYCDNYYGTPAGYVQELMDSGLDVILEIDVQGALNIISKYPDCVSIFLLPPSFEELKRRIVGRGTEEPDVIEKRMQKAKYEVQLADRYNYIVINDEVEKAVSSINSILVAEKLRASRNKDILLDLKLI